MAASLPRQFSSTRKRLSRWRRMTRGLAAGQYAAFHDEDSGAGAAQTDCHMALQREEAIDEEEQPARVQHKNLQRGYLCLANVPDRHLTAKVPQTSTQREGGEAREMLQVSSSLLTWWCSEFLAHSVAEIRAGRTPNPGVLCNSHINFGAFYNHIDPGEFDRVASGDYARVDQQQPGGALRLPMSSDEVEDQTYFLSHLSQRQLQRPLFPLGCPPKAPQTDCHVALKREQAIDETEQPARVQHENLQRGDLCLANVPNGQLLVTPPQTSIEREGGEPREML
eukprot:jgi/Mesen1/6082/ME000031S05358